MIGGGLAMGTIPMCLEPPFGTDLMTSRGLLHAVHGVSLTGEQRRHPLLPRQDRGSTSEGDRRWRA